MLRRTLVLFTALTLLGLTMVLVYAWLNVHSARDAVDRAEVLIKAGKTSDAVELLDQAERSSGGSDQDLLRRILRFRYRAHDQIRNYKHARQDLERLQTLGDRSLDLELDRVRILRGAGEVDLARSEALRLYEAHPDSAPCLQAAGECIQESYQSDLKKLLEEWFDKLPADDSLRAKRLMLVFLYRPSSDGEAARARAEFDELIRDKMPDQVRRGRLDAQIAKVADGIARSAGFYRRALEAGPETAPAFRGLSWILIQQGRTDDAALLAEIYLRRFDTGRTASAAERGAQLHLKRGRPAEALRIVNDWKRGRTCTEQVKLLEMDRDEEQRDAVQAWRRGADAMWELGLARELRALSTEFFDFEFYLSSKFGTWNFIPDDRYLNGLAFLAEKNWGEAFGKLDEYVKGDLDLPRRKVDEIDRFARVMELLYLAAKQSGKKDKVVDILSHWISQRPDDARPYALRAREQEDAGEYGMANRDLHACVLLEPESEAFLTDLLSLAEKMYGRELGSKDLLQNLLRFQGTDQSPPDRVLHLGVAEEALRLGQGLAQEAPRRALAKIARESAQSAVREFPRSPRPMRAYVRACLMEDNPRQAISELEALRRISPPKTEDLELLLEARKKNLRPVADVVRDLLLEDSSLGHAPELMSHCLARGAHREVLAIGAQFLKVHGNRGDALLSMGISEQALGNNAHALELFARIPETARERIEGVERSLYERAKSGERDECLRLARELVRLAGDSGEILVRAGTRLADMRATEAALACLTPIVDERRFAQLRSAKILTRMAEIMLNGSGDELGDQGRAEILLEGAISMADGGRAKVLLATLYATLGRIEEADEVNSFPQRDASVPVDVQAGLLIRLGRRPAALEMIEEALKTNATDHALLALRAVAALSTENGKSVLAKGRATGIPDLDSVVVAHPLELLDLLTLPRLAGFGDRIARAEFVLQQSHLGDPWVWFFIARSRELQGDWKNAIGFHWRLLADQPRFYPAYDALYRLQSEHDPTALTQPTLVMEYVKLAVSGLLPVLSPRMMSGVVLQMSALTDLAKGDAGGASHWRLVAWMLDPRSFELGRDLALDALVQGRTSEAFIVLDILWDRVPPAERIAFQDLYFQAARALLAQTDDASLKARTRTRAEKVLREVGILGSALHFLADTSPAGTAPVPNEGLVAHVRYLMDHGLSPALDLRGIERSLDILIARSGPKTVLPLLDDLLSADPSLFPFWITRARLLARERDPKEAGRSLRWILEYLDDREAARGLADVDAAADSLSAHDEELIRRVIGADSDAPEDRSALALLAWRRGQHAEVIRLLSGAPRELRGIELYARASARIASGRAEDLRLAAEDLDELGTRTATSMQAQEATFLAHEIRLIR